MDQQLTAKHLMDAGLSRSFAHHIVAGSRQVSVSLALWLLDECGVTVPTLEGKSKKDLDALRGMYPPRAPEVVVKRREAVSAQQAA